MLFLTIMLLLLSNVVLVISWYLSRDVNSYELVQSSFKNLDKYFSRKYVKFLKYLIMPPESLLPLMIIIQPIFEEYVFRYVPLVKLYIQRHIDIISTFIICLTINALWTLLHYPQYRRLLKFKHWLCIYLAGLGFLTSSIAMLVLSTHCALSDMYVWLTPTIQHIIFNCCGYFRDRFRSSK